MKISADYTRRFVHWILAALIMTSVFVVGLSSIVVAPVSAVSANGNIDVNALVPGVPPTTPAEILSPQTNTKVSQPIISIEGVCGPELVVRIFRNGTLAGTTICTLSGEFSVQITLVPGKNIITALNYDFLDQAGPVSAEIVVTYTVDSTQSQQPPTSRPTNRDSQQRPLTRSGTEPFYATSDYSIRLLRIGQEANYTITIFGGQTPYGINVDWGDGQTDNYEYSQQSLSLRHIYENGGRYHIKVSVTDRDGASAFLQLVAIVGEEARALDALSQTKVTQSDQEMAIALWAAYAVVTIVLVGITVLYTRRKKEVVKEGEVGNDIPT